MTKQEAAVISAYTGILLGEFHPFHVYAEMLLKRPIWTHEFGTEGVIQALKQASETDFMQLRVR